MKLRGPILAAMLAATPPAAAQVKFGNFSLTGNGLVSAGYAGNYGNQTPSNHGVTLGGAGSFGGSYYSPNFLSFTIQPYLNQSRDSSGYQSITTASGVSSSASIFGGSNFPGSVSYSRGFNKESNFNVPGLGDFASHGDDQVFQVGWSEIVPNRPSVSASFIDGSNHYSLYGAPGDLSSDYHSFLVQSNYQVLGFTLNGSYRESATHSETPEVFSSTPEANDSDTSAETISIGHKLPFHGSFSASASHSEINADFSGAGYHTGIDTVYGGLSFSPVARLNFGTNYQYTDNLAAALDQPIVTAGGVAEAAPQGTHSSALTSYASYTIPSIHVTVSGADDYRAQDFLGLSYRSNAETGTIGYGNSLLGGFLNATVGVTRDEITSSNQSSLGTLASVNYSRDVKRWSVSLVGNYSRNAQTALIAYNSDGYGYSATAGRKFGRKSHWSGSASGSRTRIGQSGSTSFTQSYSTVMSIRWIGVSGSYSKSSGNAVLTAVGLTPVTVPLSVLTPASVIAYGGYAYSAGIGLTPIRGFTLSVTYSDAFTNTQADSVDNARNHTQQFNAFLQYRMRKIYFTAGYTKLSQSFSANNNFPAVVATYYFTINRWFNFL